MGNCCAKCCPRFFSDKPEGSKKPPNSACVVLLNVHHHHLLKTESSSAQIKQQNPLVPKFEILGDSRSPNPVRGYPSILPLKPLPNRLSPVTDKVFESVTRKIKLLHPTTLQIDIPANKRFMNSIRPTPWLSPQAFELLSATEVLQVGGRQYQSAAVEIHKPAGSWLY